MLQYFVELAGTFFFLSVIMVAANSNIKWAAFPIGLALALVVYWGGNVSGGHFNPAVSTMFFADHKISLIQYIAYVVCQIVGGLIALLYYKQSISFMNNLIPSTNS